MNKGLKIVLIVIVCVLIIGLVGGGIAFFAIGNAAHTEEYKLGDDTIKSIEAVVEKRDVTSVSTEIHDGIKTKSIKYQSDSVQEDLITYVQYLRDEGGFSLLKDMDLSQIPSAVHLGKTSIDPGKLIIIIIDYDAFGYTVTLQKGEGTLTIY